MATSASRGFFTTSSSPKAVSVVGAAVAGRTMTGQARQLTFQELKQHHIRTFSTSGIRNNNNSNALTRFASNFTIDSSNKVVYTIVAINVAVFGVWQYAEGNAKRFHDGRLYMFMFRHFTDSLQNLKEGRVWTLVTSAFSHKEWYHILLNTMVLLSFGDPVSSRFLTVYFAGLGCFCED
jgi:membrane associated rhomboid family serine protease